MAVHHRRKRGGGALYPPPPLQTKVIKGKSCRAIFWYTNFWVPDPSSPSPLLPLLMLPGGGGFVMCVPHAHRAGRCAADCP